MKHYAKKTLALTLILAATMTAASDSYAKPRREIKCESPSHTPVRVTCTKLDEGDVISKYQCTEEETLTINYRDYTKIFCRDFKLTIFGTYTEWNQAFYMRRTLNTTSVADATKFLTKTLIEKNLKATAKYKNHLLFPSGNHPLSQKYGIVGKRPTD